MTAEETVPPSVRGVWFFPLLVIGLCFVSSPALAQWQKTITCPAGHVYRDLRIDAGRFEFCVLELPGHLWVRDGDSRWWYSEGHFGEEGSYKLGRKIGRWKECSRFDQCETRTYELLYPLEKLAFWSNIGLTANMVDVECAAIAPSKLTVRLNAYAEKLVLHQMDGRDFKIEACGGKYSLSLAGTSIDTQNRTLFYVDLSKNLTVAARQRACISAYAPPQQTCTTK
jgi:hypothetical protein